MVRYYFELQWKRLKRRFLEIGVAPIFGILLSLATFLLLVRVIVLKSAQSDLILFLLALILIFKTGVMGRLNQLRAIFKDNPFYKIRLAENLLLALPFFIVLLTLKSFYFAIALVLAVLLLAILRLHSSALYVIPTPFRRIPFEFILGFRKNIALILLAYFLIIKAIQVDNFNLGLFSLGLLFLIGMSFYLKPEKTYFVWIYSSEVIGFLKTKIYQSILCSTILSIPIFLTLLAFYPSSWLLICAVQLLGYLFIGSMVLAKYSAYPEEMNVPQALLYGLCLWFPPMFLIVLPIFYKQSKRRLSPILR